MASALSRRGGATAPALSIDPALALLEFSSIAAGIQSADAMAKKAALDVIHPGTVDPGHYLVLIGGSVAEVEEALKAGKLTAPDALLDHVFLPGVHPEVVRGLAGGRDLQTGDALGIIETTTAPAAIHAADAGVKGAQVALLEVRLADGLHGKGLALFTGLVSDVEAAVELAAARVPTGYLVRQVVIPQVEPRIAALIRAQVRFGPQVGW
jgi:microcompartment protein CcmL/EutN